MTIGEMRVVLNDVTYPGYLFHLGSETDREGGKRPWLQVRFLAPDITTGRSEIQHGRKWFLSPHMTKSEIVSTALKAVLAAVEHEAREQFRYRGKAIYGPHFDVDALAQFASRRDNFDMRTGAWVE